MIPLAPAARVAALLAVVVAALLPVVAAPPAEADFVDPAVDPRGMAGSSASFYAMPDRLPRQHGGLVRQKAYRGALAVPHAINRKIVYSQRGVHGGMVVTSGLVSAPPGESPPGGWPVVTWGHGTTGAADVCAPSVRPSASLRANPANALIESWVDRGWAVVRTDYEGLGTRGLHPYLVGRSAGRSMLDAVLAAQDAFPEIGDRIAIAGSSQGGHAALWAAAVAPTYAARLEVTSTVAFAPPSHLAAQLTAARTLPVNNLTATLALILRGVDVEEPALKVRRVLTDRAAAVWPRQRRECQEAMAGPDAYGAVPASELIRPEADTTAILAAIDRNGAESLAPPGPLLVLQGLQDMTVMPPTSAALVARYSARGSDVEYRTYPNAAHGTVVADGGDDATAFIAAHLS